MGQGTKKPVIVISRTDRMGDVLLSFPAFHRAREIFPNARIIVLIRRYTLDLLYGQQHIDRIICIDDPQYTRQSDTTANPNTLLIKELQSEMPDFFVALYTDKLIGYLARHCGARYRIGPLSKLHSWFTYNRGILQKRSRTHKHEYEYNLELVNRMSRFAGKAPALAISAATMQEQPYTRFFYGIDHAKYAEQFLIQQYILGQTEPLDKLIVINPFTGGSAKNIPLDKYLFLGNLLCTKLPNAHVIYSTIPRNPHHLISQQLQPHQHLFVNEGSILVFAALMNRAQLYIGASTGTTHIAAFLNKAVIAFYPRIRNQSPTRWGAIGNDRITFIQPDAPCPKKYGCRQNCPHYDCFASIDINLVALEAVRLLS